MRKTGRKIIKRTQWVENLGKTKYERKVEFVTDQEQVKAEKRKQQAELRRNRQQLSVEELEEQRERRREKHRQEEVCMYIHHLSAPPPLRPTTPPLYHPTAPYTPNPPPLPHPSITPPLRLTPNQAARREHIKLTKIKELKKRYGLGSTRTKGGWAYNLAYLAYSLYSLYYAQVRRRDLRVPGRWA